MKVKFKYLLNPLYVIVMQYVLLFYIYNKCVIKDTYVIKYIIYPFIIYLLFVIFTGIFREKKNFNKDSTYKMLHYSDGIAMNIFLIITISIIVLSDLQFFHRINFSISGINKSVIWDIQTNATLIEKTANYIILLSPIINLVLYYNSYNNNMHKKYYRYLLMFYNILVVIYSFIAGKRILIVLAIFPLIIARYYNSNINFKLLRKIIFTIIGILIIFQFNQMIKFENKQIKGNIEIISNYFEKSVENGMRVIGWRYGNINPYYWTVYRQLLSIPKHEFLGINENKLKNIPIHSREDDFAYVANMGLGSTYNTFSIFGYSYLDFGFSGVWAIVLNFIVIHSLYYKFIYKGGIYIFIYPVVYICLLDQIIANGIYSSRILYMGIGLVILNLLCFLGKIKIKSNRRSV